MKQFLNGKDDATISVGDRLSVDLQFLMDWKIEPGRAMLVA